MLKYTCRNLFIVPERTGLPDRHLVLSGTARTGLLFISPPKRSDFRAAARTGLQWRSVNKRPIRYTEIASLRCNPV